MSLTAKQKNFLLKKFSLTEDKIKNLSNEELRYIWSECTVIEGVEYEKSEQNGEPVSVDGLIAEQLADLPLTEWR